MAGEDFEFPLPPQERREARQFEPPPWEREAFEDLARKREETSSQESGAQKQSPETQPSADVAASESARADIASHADETGQREPDAGAQPRRAVDEAQLTEMMAGLRAQEPTPMQTYGAVAIALSAFTGLMGIVMLVWAMAMFVSATARGTGRVGIISGSIVGFFGALFIGLSIWVGVRTLRQRGVL